MKKTALCLAMMAFLLPPLASGAAPPPELAKLRQQFTARWRAAPDEAARMDTLDDYVRELTSLVYYMRGNSRGREEINAVRRELRRADEARLGEMDRLLDQEEAAVPAPRATEPQPEKPAAAPAPRAAEPQPEKPAPPARPETVVLTARGLAGAPDFSRNNVYAFTLKHPGSRTTLTYLASGRRSTDTYGDILITSPTGGRRRAARWRPDDFSQPAERDGCAGTAPVTVDISDYVSGPGSYAVEFHWTDGIAPLVICRVEIESRP